MDRSDGGIAIRAVSLRRWASVRASLSKNTSCSSCLMAEGKPLIRAFLSSTSFGMAAATVAGSRPRGAIVSITPPTASSEVAAPTPTAPKKPPSLPRPFQNLLVHVYGQEPFHNPLSLS